MGRVAGHAEGRNGRVVPGSGVRIHPAPGAAALAGLAGGRAGGRLPGTAGRHHPRDHQLPVGDGRGRDPGRAGPPAGQLLTVATVRRPATTPTVADRQGVDRPGPDDLRPGPRPGGGAGSDHVRPGPILCTTRTADGRPPEPGSEPGARAPRNRARPLGTAATCGTRRPAPGSPGPTPLQSMTPRARVRRGYADRRPGPRRSRPGPPDRVAPPGHEEESADDAVFVGD